MSSAVTVQYSIMCFSRATVLGAFAFFFYFLILTNQVMRGMVTCPHVPPHQHRKFTVVACFSQFLFCLRTWEFDFWSTISADKMRVPVLFCHIFFSKFFLRDLYYFNWYCVYMVHCLQCICVLAMDQSDFSYHHMKTINIALREGKQCTGPKNGPSGTYLLHVMHTLCQMKKVPLKCFNINITGKSVGIKLITDINTQLWLYKRLFTKSVQSWWVTRQRTKAWKFGKMW